MSKRKRRSYTEEFSRESVKLVSEQGYSLSEAARNLGVHANMTHPYVRNSLDQS